MNTFSDRLKYARNLRGYTQQELARVSGLSQSAIASYESGSRQSTRSLRKLANALKVKLDWLDTGKGDMEAVDTNTPFASRLKEPDNNANYPHGSPWPFNDVTPGQYQKLSAQQKQLTENVILALIESGVKTPRS